jgi:hypothetical protein
MTVSNKRGNNREQKYHLYDSEGKEVELQNSDGEKDIGDDQSWLMDSAPFTDTFCFLSVRKLLTQFIVLLLMPYLSI